MSETLAFNTSERIRHVCVTRTFMLPAAMDSGRTLEPEEEIRGTCQACQWKRRACNENQTKSTGRRASNTLQVRVLDIEGKVRHFHSHTWEHHAQM
ncbi:uncharacterized protein LOC142559634 isoform X2 [Dermacentor variabilis]|uniref:uncharacterized protein LOC142559634 isoform X2 n=1 Tax=Dermacentor variabilis TaxID=34621 RepID=UPI003F5B75B2